MSKTSLIVIGGLNTDIMASGLPNFPKPNDPVYGGKLVIGPGGKPANIASMAARLMPPDTVSIVSRTVKDQHNLWAHPINNLRECGVSTEYVHILESSQTDKQPAVALLAVDPDGNNMCFVIPGISVDFDESDIGAATPAFEAAGRNGGLLALTLENPIATARHAMRKANNLGMRIAFDLGGIVAGMDVESLLAQKPYLCKPNEHEARILSGITITDFATAGQAAARLQELGAQNVFITHGENGGYLFAANEAAVHIPIPQHINGEVKDATGCGDQSMATLCAYLQAGESLQKAAELAILTGTMQFYRIGIQPITKAELEAAI